MIPITLLFGACHYFPDIVIETIEYEVIGDPDIEEIQLPFWKEERCAQIGEGRNNLHELPSKLPFFSQSSKEQYYLDGYKEDMPQSTETTYIHPGFEQLEEFFTQRLNNPELDYTEFLESSTPQFKGIVSATVSREVIEESYCDSVGFLGKVEMSEDLESYWLEPASYLDPERNYYGLQMGLNQEVAKIRKNGVNIEYGMNLGLYEAIFGQPPHEYFVTADFFYPDPTAGRYRKR